MLVCYCTQHWPGAMQGAIIIIGWWHLDCQCKSKFAALTLRWDGLDQELIATTSMDVDGTIWFVGHHIVCPWSVTVCSMRRLLMLNTWVFKSWRQWHTGKKGRSILRKSWLSFNTGKPKAAVEKTSVTLMAKLQDCHCTHWWWHVTCHHMQTKCCGLSVSWKKHCFAHGNMWLHVWQTACDGVSSCGSGVACSTDSYMLEHESLLHTARICAPIHLVRLMHTFIMAECMAQWQGRPSPEYQQCSGKMPIASYVGQGCMYIQAPSGRVHIVVLMAHCVLS